MRNGQRDRQVVKALLLSAGLLVIPVGTVAASEPNQERDVDVFAVQEEVDHLLDDVRGEVSTPNVPVHSSYVLDDVVEEERAASEVGNGDVVDHDASDSNQSSLQVSEETSVADGAKDEGHLSESADEDMTTKGLEEGVSSSDVVEASDVNAEAFASSCPLGAEEGQMNVAPSEAVAVLLMERASTDNMVQDVDLSKVVTIEAPPETVRAAAVVGGFLRDISGNILKNSWVEFKGEYYFTNAHGYAYANQFITFGPKIAYYLDEKGRLLRGVQTIQGSLMLLDESTAILHRDNAWVEQSDGVYFPNADGVLVCDQFITVGDDTYYVGADATRQGGVVQTADGRLYLMEAGTDKLIQEVNVGLNDVNGKSIYIDPETLTVDYDYMTDEEENVTELPDLGSARNQDVVIEGKHYYAGADGTVEAGLHEVDGKLYFYDPALGNQRRDASGQVTWQGKDYYIKTDGTVSRSELIVVNKQTYKTDAQGVMKESKKGLILDISRYQDPDDVDFDELAQHISGVILRAGFTGWGEKTLHEDPTFDRYYEEFTKRGIPVGAYWFSCAQNEADGKKEAQKMLEIIRGKKLELPLFWDTESEERQREVPKQQLTNAGISFLETIEDVGYYVGIYASASWLVEKLDMSRLSDYDVWVAHYGVSKPAYSGDYDMWQFTSSYRLPGYNGNLDASWCYVDYPSIIRRAGLNHLN